MRKLGLTLAMLALSACGEVDMVEVGRAPSPDGRLDAVVASLPNKAFVVVVVKPGEKPGKGQRVLIADRTDAPKVEWTAPERVTITCPAARVWSYRNFWDAGDNRTVVSVALACGEQGFQPEK